jgi:subtilase family serine protease
VFVASGDAGYTGTQSDYPSTSAYVTGVGGTSLVKSTNTRGWTEGAWSSGGSSCSKAIAKPSYQTSTACAKRMAADVAAVGDPNTGLAVYNQANGGWIVVGGTSASSPLVAGIFARYGIAATTGHDASFAYTHRTEFFDVTSGTNGRCTSALCRAAAGWDGPTGIGSPNGATLAP